MFKNLAKRLMNDGHKCVFFIQQRNIIEDLVIKEGFAYKYIVSPYWRDHLKGKLGISIRGIMHLLQASFRVFSYSLLNKVDMYLGTDISITYVGNIFRKPSLVFTDDDYYYTKQYAQTAYPFATHILAADVVDIGKWAKKKIAYSGNQKLGYLHPNVFQPDVNVLKKYNLRVNEYSIIRLVNFAALHDSVNQMETGLSHESLQNLMPILSKHGKVILDMENKNNSFFKEYQIDINPEDMHSLLYFARLFISDSQSMHVEAGLLGTPAIRTNAWVDKPKPLNVITDLENRYGLGISISPKNPHLLVNKVSEMIQDGVKESWQDKRDKALKDYIDFTAFLYWFITEYPDSFVMYINNPDSIGRMFIYKNSDGNK
jgi:predicted glycosyltransferase